MFRLDPKNEQDFLEQFKKSAKSSGSFYKGIIPKFKGNLHASLSEAVVQRPWFMQATSYFYRLKLQHYEKQFALTLHASITEKIEQAELLENLNFAVHHGHRANAEQRAWCLNAIYTYRVSPLDAPFLVWCGVINLRRQTIVFGHWDWIFGSIMMLPALQFYLLAVLGALSSNTPLKIVLTMTCLAISLGFFDFYRTIHFKAFQVGSKYFKPDGLRYTPLQR